MARRAEEPKPRRGAARKTEPAADIGAAITDRLRSFYDGVLGEPVPEALTALIEQMASDEGQREDGSD